MRNRNTTQRPGAQIEQQSDNEKVGETLEELLKRYVTEDTYSFGDFEVLTVNTVGKELETPLHMACTRNAERDVRLLIDGGANVNAQTNIGTTPLMRAIYPKNETIVRLLLDAGADIELKDIYGSNAVDIARSALTDELQSIVELLEKTRQLRRLQ